MACNSTENTNQVASPATPSSTEEKVASAPVACGKMIFFQSGAEIGSKTYDGSGKEVSSQYVKIVDVKNENGMTVAYVESSDTILAYRHVTNMKYNYKCDGRSIYFDLTSILRSSAQGQNAKFEGSVIEYPIAVSAGQTLPDANGTMSIEKGGRKTTVKYHYKDRKVAGKEDVTTPAGSWNCYKISNTVAVEMDIPGMSEKDKKMIEARTNQMKTTSVTWFSPDFGIVKMEMYQNGKMQSKTEVFSVKR
jgi:hypothetical protein